MTISSASKLVKFRAPALQNLILRHLLHPSAAACTNPVPDAHFFDPSRLPKEGFYPRRRSSFVTKICNIDESNSPLCFNASFRFSVMQFEAARKLVSGTSEDTGSENGAYADVDVDAYCQPKGKKASYDSDDSDDAHPRDSYDSDSNGGDSSDEDDCFNEGGCYSDNEDCEKGSDYSDDDDYEVKRRSKRDYFDREGPPSLTKKYL